MQEFHLLPESQGSEFQWPLGSWEALGVAIGDASGGAVILTLDFTDNYLFSYEGWNMSATFGTLGNFQTTFRPNIVQGGQSYALTAPLVVGATIDGISPRDMRVTVPMTSGVRGGLVTPQLTITNSANVNTNIYRANAWGHYWDRRSRLTSTGPLRAVS